MNKMYNFVFFQNPNDYYKVAFRDSRQMANVKVEFGMPLDNTILKRVYRLHFSEKLNRFFEVPFKGLWNSKYYVDEFKDSSLALCFVYNGGTLSAVASGLVDYLKKKYPNSRHVCFLQDLVSSYNPRYISLFNKFDFVISYDYNDVKNFGFLYHPTIYSKIVIPDNPLVEEKDVYFLGAAKDRMKQILYYYDLFTSNGLKCNFLIANVEKKNRKELDGIRYIEKISYIENLQNVVKSKAILDIIQKTSRGYTLRTWEAIYYNKILLSNNPSISNIQCNSKGAYLLEKNIDYHSIFNEGVNYDSSWTEQTSLKHLITFIENYLN